MNPITTCLWFNGTARQAATFYTQIFPNSHVEGGTKSPADNPSVSEGEELMVSFTLNGMPFVGLNGGPHFQFNESVSFMISTDGQDETDRYWEAMTADGGAPGSPVRSMGSAVADLAWADGVIEILTEGQ